MQHKPSPLLLSTGGPAGSAEIRHDGPMDWRDVAATQDGVITRRQLESDGLAPHSLRRLVNRRELAPMHRGVFLTHTGEPTWRQRAWGAVLHAEPAALWGPSALAAIGSTKKPPSNTDSPLHLAVDHTRRVATVPGTVLHRVVDLEHRVRWAASPPRVRVEEAAIDTAARAKDEFAAIAVLTDVVQRGLTTPERLSAALRHRRRLPRSRLMASVLADLTEGTDSVLEHRYLTQVERLHGLPRGRRQLSLPGSDDVRDVVYEAARVIVELDGRAYHSVANARFTDLVRDTTALVAGHVTVRLGWGQVIGEPCRTAHLVADLLIQRGWTSRLRQCPDCSRG